MFFRGNQSLVLVRRNIMGLAWMWLGLARCLTSHYDQSPKTRVLTWWITSFKYMCVYADTGNCVCRCESESSKSFVFFYLHHWGQSVSVSIRELLLFRIPEDLSFPPCPNLLSCFVWGRKSSSFLIFFSFWQKLEESGWYRVKTCRKNSIILTGFYLKVVSKSVHSSAYTLLLPLRARLQGCRASNRCSVPWPTVCNWKLKL